MTWFWVELIVVCALFCGFMATHSLAAALVSAAPVVAAMAWLRTMPVDGPTFWLAGGVPLLASILGLVLGQYIRHRAKARDLAAAAPPAPERPALSQVALDTGQLEPSAQLHRRTLGFIAGKVVSAGDHGGRTRAGKTPVFAAIGGGGAGSEH